MVEVLDKRLMPIYAKKKTLTDIVQSLSPSFACEKIIKSQTIDIPNGNYIDLCKNTQTV